MLIAGLALFRVPEPEGALDRRPVLHCGHNLLARSVSEVNLLARRVLLTLLEPEPFVLLLLGLVRVHRVQLALLVRLLVELAGAPDSLFHFIYDLLVYLVLAAPLLGLQVAGESRR